MLIGICSAVAGFIGMEPISWAVHKFIMHGPLWFIHKTHHQPEGHSVFELNDLFSLFFGLSSIFLIVWGLSGNVQMATGFGVGIALYGFTYFVLHDLLIHKRIRLLRKVKLTGTLLRLANAHYIHHQNRKSRESRFYGLLVVNEKKQAL